MSFPLSPRPPPPTGPALCAAQTACVSVIIKEAMANGRLTPRNEDPAFKEKLQLLCDTARQVSLAAGQLAWSPA